MNILYEYVLFCEVAIHHERRRRPPYPPSVPSRSLPASLGPREPSPYSLMSLITLCGGQLCPSIHSGWTDGEMDDGKGGGGKRHFPTPNVSFSLALPLMAAVISHAPALNGDASERNTAAANRRRRFCSDWSAVLTFI